MKNYKYNAFTLIEVIVSITIFSIMSISIIWIYIISTDITLKADINRIMQENIKNVTNKISEDIRKNGILGVSSSIGNNCNLIVSSNKYKSGNKLCIKGGTNYFLAKKNIVTNQFIRTDASSCSNIKDNCVIAKSLTEPLTNSFISIKELNFYLSTDAIPKITINIVAQPATGKGVKSELIKETRLIFQTTISERPF